LSTQAATRRFPPVTVTVYVRDTEKGDAKSERRLNEGINVAATSTFAPVAPGRGAKIWANILAGMAVLAACFLVLTCVMVILIALSALLAKIDLEEALDQPLVYWPGALAIALGAVAYFGLAAVDRSERSARLAAADRALPYLGLAPLRLADSDDHDFTALRMKLSHARANAKYSAAREAELLAAIRALGDYHRCPTPDPIGRQMNGAAHLFSDRAVKKLAREFRAAEAARAAALVRVTALVDRLARSVEDENLVVAARKRVAAEV
jgi:hypothetical protein